MQARPPLSINTVPPVPPYTSPTHLHPTRTQARSMGMKGTNGRYGGRRGCSLPCTWQSRLAGSSSVRLRNLGTGRDSGGSASKPLPRLVFLSSTKNVTLMTHIGDHTSSTQTSLAFRPDDPFQHVPHVRFVAPTCQSMSDDHCRRIFWQVFVVRRGDVDCADEG